MNSKQSHTKLFAVAATLCIIPFFSGCLLSAAGAGGEAAYVATQENRSTSEVLTDQRITSTIKTQLLADQEVSGLNINVDTFKSNVTLKGYAHSQHEIDRAVSIARSVSGVKSVSSKLDIQR